MNNSLRHKKDGDNNWIWLYTVAVLIIAAVVNIAMYLPIPTLEPLDVKDWLNFWGGYLGGVIGCIPAFAALRDNRRQAKQQYEQFQEELKESRQQAKQHYEEAERNRRLSVQPIFAFELTPIDQSFLDVPDIDFQFTFDFSSGLQKLGKIRHPATIRSNFQKYPGGQTFFALRNLGFGPALNVKLVYEETTDHYKGSVDFGIIGKDETSYHIFLCKDPLPPKGQERYAIFKLVYQDVFQNQYQQTLRLLIFSDTYDFVRSGSPVLFPHKAEQTSGS